MKQELVFREVQNFGFLRGEYNAIGALFQCCFELQLVSVELTLRVDKNYHRNDIGRLRSELVR